VKKPTVCFVLTSSGRLWPFPVGFAFCFRADSSKGKQTKLRRAGVRCCTDL